jgi:hypothetical protein
MICLLWNLAATTGLHPLQRSSGLKVSEFRGRGSTESRLLLPGLVRFLQFQDSQASNKGVKNLLGEVADEPEGQVGG